MNPIFSVKPLDYFLKDSILEDERHLYAITSPTMREIKMKKPRNKEEIIKYINKFGIKDINCNSVVDGGYITFEMEIRTKNDNSFHICQSLSLKPQFEQAEVFYFDETGDGEIIADLGTGFKQNQNKS